MKQKRTYVLKLRRKREGKTDYNKRIRLLLSETPRLVIRKSLKNIQVQLIQYDAKGDKILLSAHTKELEKLGWKGSRKNIPAAYLCGLLAAKKALAAGVKKVIADYGVYTPIKGSKLYSVLKGAIDGGLEVSAAEDIMPSEERLNGKHIAEFAKNAKDIHKNQFAKYSADNIEKQIQEVKNKIMA